MLLDEPTEHLDAADSDRLLTALLTPGGLFAADRTVVVATHHLPAGLDCPRSASVTPRQPDWPPCAVTSPL